MQITLHTESKTALSGTGQREGHVHTTLTTTTTTTTTTIITRSELYTLAPPLGFLSGQILGNRVNSFSYFFFSSYNVEATHNTPPPTSYIVLQVHLPPFFQALFPILQQVGKTLPSIRRCLPSRFYRKGFQLHTRSFFRQYCLALPFSKAANTWRPKKEDLWLLDFEASWWRGWQKMPPWKLKPLYKK